MRKVLMVILILGVIVAPDTATTTGGGRQYRDYICLAPGVEGPDGGWSTR